MNLNIMGPAKAILFFLVFLRFVLPCRGANHQPADPGSDRRFGLYAGFKYIKNYTPQASHSLPQNWCILQDDRGVIYAANQKGILEFDGSSWRRIAVTHHSVISMARAPDGTIYIGGINEIGRLEADVNGELKYVSLSSRHLKDVERNFSHIYQVHCTTDNVWFRSTFILFRWHAGKLTLERKAGTKESSFRTMFTWDNKLYVQEKTVGLYQVTGNSFSLTSKDKIFLEESVSMVVPYSERQLLIGTRGGRLYLFDGIDFTDFPTEVDEYLENHDLYHGIKMSDGNFALATIGGGLVIIGNKGRLKGLYNKTFGLQDDNVKYVFQDSVGPGGNLWLALNKGISKIEYNSPLYFFGDRSGLVGIVLSVTRHKGRLFVGTSGGLYHLETATPGKSPLFRTVPNIPGYCWSLLSVGDSLLAATSRGVFLAEDTNAKTAGPVGPEISCSVLAASRTRGDRVWVGTINGWLSLRRQDRQWHTRYQYADIKHPVRSVVEDESGNLWLGTMANGVFKVDFSGKPSQPVVKDTHKYGTGQGLPEGEVYVAWANDHVMFATPEGIFQFDEKKQFFTPDLTLGKDFAGGSQSVFRMVEDQNKHIWFRSGSRNFYAKLRRDGTFSIEDTPLRRIPPDQVHTIYPDRYNGGQIVWFATDEGLIGFDTGAAAKKDYKRPFSALVRNVSILGGSTAYSGFGTVGDEPGVLPIFDYKERNLHFEVGAPFFENESKTCYRYRMEGFDENWSGWTDIAFKDYNNVDAGQYKLRVQAKNVYETASREDSFSFRVLLPWYRTWWAFSLFAMTAFLMVFLVVKWWRSRKLALEKQRLERIVEERTREINRANVQLQQKTIQLEEQSGKLKEMDKIKSRFFANISHEFRTPLTLIMGPLDQVRSDFPDMDKGKNRGVGKRIDLAYRSAQRLLGLINQLLDLSKLESGKMKLQAVQRDLVPFLKGLLEPFELAAARHQLNLTFHSGEPSIPLFFDPEKLEKVIGNLLSNAVKFTPPGGSITVSVSVVSQAGTPGQPAASSDPGREGGENKYACISVKDTGVGIAGDQLPHIFGRFYQADNTFEHYRKGSGIGLALTRELVELHHGEINVRSSREGQGENKDRGTEFILRFPLGSVHLRPEEMADIPSGSPHQDEPTSKEEGELLALEAAEALEQNRDTPDADTDKYGTMESLLAGGPGAETAKKDIILVVEDNADVRYYIRTSLEPVYTVVEARDGREGIEKAQSIIPDLIISDIMMPEVDGYELCRAVKADISTSHIAVILLTAKAAEENMVQGLEAGADDYITKPFNTRLLRTRIKNLIDLRRQLQLKLNREMVFQPSRLALTDIDREFFKDLQEVIEKNLSDQDLNVEKLSKELYMSRATLYRKIQALSGETPTDFIRSYRLMRAVQLMKSNFGSVTEVAFEVGFSSRTYFTRCFKEKFHQLPSEYIKSESKPS